MRRPTVTDVVSLVDGSTKTEKGFRIKARLVDGVFKSVAYLQVLDGLSYFPMTITMNGSLVKRKKLSEVCKDYPIKTSYMGNAVYVNPKGAMFLGWLDSFLDHVSLVWYGIPLNVTGYLHDVAVEVSEGDPLTPVLPYRTSIKHDEKAERFLEFVRKEVAGWCMEQIRVFRGQPHGDLEDMVRVMRLAGELLSPEALDGLDLFFVEVVDPYYTESTDSDEVVQYRLVRKGEGASRKRAALPDDRWQARLGRGRISAGRIQADSSSLDDHENRSSRKPAFMAAKGRAVGTRAGDGARYEPL